MTMRPSTQSVDSFVRMLREFRPCPRCGSSRVTVQAAPREGDALVARCSECGAEHRPAGKLAPA